jgi:hypothetical protein
MKMSKLIFIVALLLFGIAFVLGGNTFRQLIGLPHWVATIEIEPSKIDVGSVTLGDVMMEQSYIANSSIGQVNLVCNNTFQKGTNRITVSCKDGIITVKSFVDPFDKHAVMVSTTAKRALIDTFNRISEIEIMFEVKG